MPSTKPSILLTGASGLIGGAVLRRIVEEQYTALLPVRDPARLVGISHVPHVSTVPFDLANMSERSLSVIHDFAADVVIHCAWIGTTNRDRNLPEFVVPNIESSLRLFEVTHRAGCKKWIAIGSQDEYSQGLSGDIAEDFPTDTNSLYGNTKLAVYHALRALGTGCGVDVVWLRSFACYGKEYRPEFMIPYVVDCLKRNELPVMKTPHAVWDYFHVDDAARAILMCADKASLSGVFNLGSGKGISVSQIALTLAELIAPALVAPLEAQIRANSTLATRRVANVRKLSQELVWTTEISLEEGLKRCL